jgi:hypothetical protein
MTLTLHIDGASPETASLVARATRVELIVIGDGTVVIPCSPRESRSASVAATDSHDASALLSRQQVASWLKVSKRWVERHLRPWSQPQSRGRAWYTHADVQEQLSRLNERIKPRSARTPSAESPARRKARAGASKEVKVTQADHEVQSIESRLRGSTRGAR